MNTTCHLRLSPLWFATLASVATLAACAGDAHEDPTSVSGPLCKAGFDCNPQPLPLPPPHSVTITKDDLLNILGSILNQGTLSIDTTHTAPWIPGPIETITNPAWAKCEEDKAACDTAPVATRKECWNDAITNCVGVSPGITMATPEYSYFQFSALAKLFGATDVFIPLDTIHHSGKVDFDIDVNYIHVTITTNWSAWFSPGTTTNPEPSVSLHVTNIQSNSPTLILTGNVFGFDEVPDVDLTNMAAGVTLDHLHPTDDKQAIDYDSALSVFTFEYDVNNMVDWLADEFVDVRAKVTSHATERISAAFAKDTTHAAISKALTALVSRAIKKASPGGYATLDSVTGVGSSISVAYTPK